MKKIYKTLIIVAFAAALLLIPACKNPSGSGKTLPPADKTMLLAQIAQAQDILDTIVVSEDGYDVDDADYWYTANDANDLSAAKADAELVADGAKATQT